MAYGLPTRGQINWDDELNNSIDAIKATADSADTKASTATSTANAAASGLATTNGRVTVLEGRTTGVSSVNGQTGAVVLGATSVGAAVAADIAAASVNDRNRANHTGTQTADTISDLTETVQDAVAALLAAGTGVTLSYNDAGNTLTVTSTGGGGATDPEVVRDTIGAALIGVGLVSVAVNDVADTITITTTATANSADTALRDRATHTGTQSLDTTTDSGTRLAMTAAERTKLGGVATSATANATDAQLRDRTTHTGVQTAATISDFTTAARTAIDGVSKRVVTFPTGSEPSLTGIPDGTLWVEYTP